MTIMIMAIVVMMMMMMMTTMIIFITRSRSLLGGDNDIYPGTYVNSRISNFQWGSANNR